MPEDIRIEVGGDVRPLVKEIDKVRKKKVNLNLGGTGNFKNPLGKITGQMGEFQKALEASNARVLAFGASAGALVAVQQGLKAIVDSSIQVEKSLADINVILNVSSGTLNKFSKSLFNVAKNTGQSFSEVAEAATELSRQGLSVEETLKRTQDALVLTRLSGLKAAESVEAVTAALNSFSQAALDSSEFVSKLAAVDAAFAVSSGDLAKAIQRVGSSAQEAGVGLDELIAIVTSAQQITARGGAVIGNSFKTIFTRIQRPRVIKELENIGIGVRDLAGNTKPAIGILKDLAQTYDTLSSAQRSQIAELVGGVFQVNVLKAALRDLGKEFSLYNNALEISNTATDEAARRNEELNKTVSATLNKTIENFRKFGSQVGKITFGPAISKGLGGINAALDNIDLENAESAGEKIASGVLGGIGKFLAGPGFAVLGVTLIKVFTNLSRQVTDAFKTISGIGAASQQQLQIQQKVSQVLSDNPEILDRIEDGTLDVAEAHNLIISRIAKETSMLEKEATVIRQLSSLLTSAGAQVRTLASGGQALALGNAKLKSEGFIPNFSSREKVMKEMEIKNASYSNSSTRAVKDNIAGVGSIIRNTDEEKVKVSGMRQPFINPPKDSIEGKLHRANSIKKTGIDPYLLSEGFVPNFKNNPLGRMGLPILAGRVYEALLEGKTTADLTENEVGADIKRGKYATGEAKLSLDAALRDKNFGQGKPKGSRVLVPKTAKMDVAERLIDQKGATIAQTPHTHGDLFEKAKNMQKKAAASKNFSFQKASFDYGFIPNFATSEQTKIVKEAMQRGKLMAAIARRMPAGVLAPDADFAGEKIASLPGKQEGADKFRTGEETLVGFKKSVSDKFNKSVEKQYKTAIANSAADTFGSYNPSAITLDRVGFPQVRGRMFEDMVQMLGGASGAGSGGVDMPMGLKGIQSKQGENFLDKHFVGHEGLINRPLEVRSSVEGAKKAKLSLKAVTDTIAANPMLGLQQNIHFKAMDYLGQRFALGDDKVNLPALNALRNTRNQKFNEITKDKIDKVKSGGFIPNFVKYQIGQKLPKGRGAGGRHLAVRDQNMAIHYDPTAMFHADLVKKNNLMGKTMDGGWLFPDGRYEKIQGHDGSGLQYGGFVPNFASAKGRKTPLYDLDGTIIKEGFFNWNDPNEVLKITPNDLTALGRRLQSSKEMVDIATARAKGDAPAIKKALSKVGVNVGKVMPLASMFGSQKKKGVRKPLVNLTGPDKKRLIADKLDRDLIDNEQKNIDALGPRGIFYSGKNKGFIPSFNTTRLEQVEAGLKKADTAGDMMSWGTKTAVAGGAFFGPAGLIAGGVAGAIAAYGAAKVREYMGTAANKYNDSRVPENLFAYNRKNGKPLGTNAPDKIAAKDKINYPIKHKIKKSDSAVIGPKEAELSDQYQAGQTWWPYDAPKGRIIAGLKFVNFMQGGVTRALYSSQGNRIPKKSDGFVPNFNEILGYGKDSLGEAVDREMAATGNSRNQIGIGSNSALRTSQNPMGLGVFDKKRETSLEHGMQLARTAGIDPKTKGKSQGYIPNFAPEKTSGFSVTDIKGIGLADDEADRLADALERVRLAYSSGGDDAEELEKSTRELAKDMELSGDRLTKFNKTVDSAAKAGKAQRGILGKTKDAFLKPSKAMQGFETRALGLSFALPILTDTVKNLTGSMSEKGDAVVNSLSSSISTFSGIASVLPGPAGLAAGGLLGLAGASSGIAKALQAKGEAIKVAAEKSKEEFTKLNNNLAQYGQAFSEFQDAAKNTKTAASTLIRLREKLDNLLIDIPDEFRFEMAGITDPADLQSKIAEIVSKQAKADLQTQLSAGIQVDLDEASGVVSGLVELFGGASKEFRDIFEGSKGALKADRFVNDIRKAIDFRDFAEDMGQAQNATQIHTSSQEELIDILGDTYDASAQLQLVLRELSTSDFAKFRRELIQSANAARRARQAQEEISEAQQEFSSELRIGEQQRGIGVAQINVDMEKDVMKNLAGGIEAFLDPSKIKESVERFVSAAKALGQFGPGQRTRGGMAARGRAALNMGIEGVEFLGLAPELDTTTGRLKEGTAIAQAVEEATRGATANAVTQLESRRDFLEKQQQESVRKGGQRDPLIDAFIKEINQRLSTDEGKEFIRRGAREQVISRLGITEDPRTAFSLQDAARRAKDPANVQNLEGVLAGMGGANPKQRQEMIDSIQRQLAREEQNIMNESSRLRSKDQLTPEEQKRLQELDQRRSDITDASADLTSKGSGMSLQQLAALQTADGKSLLQEVDFGRKDETPAEKALRIANEKLTNSQDELGRRIAELTEAIRERQQGEEVKELVDFNKAELSGMRQQLIGELGGDPSDNRGMFHMNSLFGGGFDTLKESAIGRTTTGRAMTEAMDALNGISSKTEDMVDAGKMLMQSGATSGIEALPAILDQLDVDNTSQLKDRSDQHIAAATAQVMSQFMGDRSAAEREAAQKAAVAILKAGRDQDNDDTQTLLGEALELERKSEKFRRQNGIHMVAFLRGIYNNTAQQPNTPAQAAPGTPVAPAPAPATRGPSRIGDILRGARKESRNTGVDLNNLIFDPETYSVHLAGQRDGKTAKGTHTFAERYKRNAVKTYAPNSGFTKEQMERMRRESRRDKDGNIVYGGKTSETREVSPKDHTGFSFKNALTWTGNVLAGGAVLKGLGYTWDGLKWVKNKVSPSNKKADAEVVQETEDGKKQDKKQGKKPKTKPVTQDFLEQTRQRGQQIKQPAPAPKPAPTPVVEEVNRYTDPAKLTPKPAAAPTTTAQRTILETTPKTNKPAIRIGRPEVPGYGGEQIDPIKPKQPTPPPKPRPKPAAAPTPIKQPSLVAPTLGPRKPTPRVGTGNLKTPPKAPSAGLQRAGAAAAIFSSPIVGATSYYDDKAMLGSNPESQFLSTAQGLTLGMINDPTSLKDKGSNIVNPLLSPFEQFGESKTLGEAGKNALLGGPRLIGGVLSSVGEILATPGEQTIGRLIKSRKDKTRQQAVQAQAGQSLASMDRDKMFRPKSSSLQAIEDIESNLGILGGAGYGVNTNPQIFESLAAAKPLIRAQALSGESRNLETMLREAHGAGMNTNTGNLKKAKDRLQGNRVSQLRAIQDEMIRTGASTEEMTAFQGQLDSSGDVQGLIARTLTKQRKSILLGGTLGSSNPRNLPQNIMGEGFNSDLLPDSAGDIAGLRRYRDYTNQAFGTDGRLAYLNQQREQKAKRARELAARQAKQREETAQIQRNMDYSLGFMQPKSFVEEGDDLKPVFSAQQQQFQEFERMGGLDFAANVYHDRLGAGRNIPGAADRNIERFRKLKENKRHELTAQQIGVRPEELPKNFDEFDPETGMPVFGLQASRYKGPTEAGMIERGLKIERMEKEMASGAYSGGDERTTQKHLEDLKIEQKLRQAAFEEARKYDPQMGMRGRTMAENSVLYNDEMRVATGMNEGIDPVTGLPVAARGIDHDKIRRLVQMQGGLRDNTAPRSTFGGVIGAEAPYDRLEGYDPITGQPRERPEAIQNLDISSLVEQFQQMIIQMREEMTGGQNQNVEGAAVNTQDNTQIVINAPSQEELVAAYQAELERRMAEQTQQVAEAFRAAGQEQAANALLAVANAPATPPQSAQGGFPRGPMPHSR